MDSFLLQFALVGLRLFPILSSPGLFRLVSAISLSHSFNVEIKKLLTLTQISIYPGFELIIQLYYSLPIKLHSCSCASGCSAPIT